MPEPSPDFRRRALFEADRYGSDSWVFLRELLQNARDAGATRVELRAETVSDASRLSCRDDGAGMTLSHAERYLFTLYASSKDKEPGSAGRFGVGFWSVLRFKPVRIVVRSWPAQGRAWEITLSGDLARAEQGEPPSRATTGTEIVLEGSTHEGDLVRTVFEVLWREARFLTQRDDPDRRLAVSVNGRAVNATFDLPPPRSCFSRGPARGVVALGEAPRVELFAKGLHVRAAATLGDLVAPTGAPPLPPDLGEGIFPLALLEGRDLDLLLARSDARNDRALGRLVRLAEQELERLLARQLDALRPRPLGERLAALRTRLAAALLIGAAGLVGAGALRFRPASEAPRRVALADVSPRPYRDLAGKYAGPEMDTPIRGERAIALEYSPREESPSFAALVVDRLDAEGHVPPPEENPTRPYLGSPCAAPCLEVRLLAAGGPGPLRLPVPTGHGLDPSHVLVDGGPVPVTATATDQPVVFLTRSSPVQVRYRTGPASPPRAELSSPPPLPQALDHLARQLRGRPLSERVSRLLEVVRAAVVYSTDEALVARHRAAAAAGQPFLERALAVGAGDCDIQNGVLTLLLQAAGVPSRLAVGYLGEGGRVAAPLHAWVEYGDGSRPWQVADASASSAPARTLLGAASPPAAPPSRLPPDPKPAPRALRLPLMSPALPLVILATLGAIGTGLLWARRTRRSLKLDPGADLPRLLRGALQHPDGFGPGSAIFQHRLIPLYPRGCISLGRSWELAAEARLYSTRTRSPLAVRLARTLTVVDAGRPEGALVADTLGAVDLDGWDRLLARSRTGRLLDAFNASLRRRGEGWSIRRAPGAGAINTLRLPMAPGRWREVRVVVLGDDLAWLCEADALFERRPAEALFTIADRLLAQMGVEARDQALFLAPLARAALLEATP